MKNDKHYVALTLSGDEDAFRHLVDKYKNSVYGIILSKIEISDNGTGIPERFPPDKSLISVRDKIFKVGFSTKEEGGMGMGLPIAREAIEAHGGHIDFTSEEGKRTTFIIELPFPVWMP